MSSIIEVAHLSKLYQRGLIGTGSLKQDIYQWWSTAVLRRENPFFKIADENENSDYFWALNDVSFSVEAGEILGIIGKNGSGKSTLLKIISRITSPTKGKVTGRGKISSMLEVGTRFSPDLTGRQNIYLSGHILGMQKEEIQRKFDEIVAFSGVEAFLDTPVKRYSSGMYVRLAFAVAAHLNTDIMIIDEVLAVGDAEFQEKCLAKMNQVTKSEGRTILFVTHNMQPVKSLCHRAVWLNGGKVMDIGAPAGIVKRYLGTLGYAEQYQHWHDAASAPGNEWIKMKRVEVQKAGGSRANFSNSDTVTVHFDFWNFIREGEVEVTMGLYTDDGTCVAEVSAPPQSAGEEMTYSCEIPAGILNAIPYCVGFKVYRRQHSVPVAEFPYALYFEVKNTTTGLTDRPVEGVIRPPFRGTLFASGK